MRLVGSTISCEDSSFLRGNTTRCRPCAAGHPRMAACGACLGPCMSAAWKCQRHEMALPGAYAASGRAARLLPRTAGGGCRTCRAWRWPQTGWACSCCWATKMSLDATSLGERGRLAAPCTRAPLPPALTANEGHRLTPAGASRRMPSPRAAAAQAGERVAQQQGRHLCHLQGRLHHRLIHGQVGRPALSWASLPGPTGRCRAVLPARGRARSGPPCPSCALARHHQITSHPLASAPIATSTRRAHRHPMPPPQVPRHQLAGLGVPQLQRRPGPHRAQRLRRHRARPHGGECRLVRLQGLQPPRCCLGLHCAAPVVQDLALELGRAGACSWPGARRTRHLPASKP